MAGGAIRAEIWLAIICEHSTKAVIAEVNYSERQKIEVEVLLGAANDDGYFRHRSGTRFRLSDNGVVALASRSVAREWDR